MKIAITGASGFIGREFRKNIDSSVSVVALSRENGDGLVKTDYTVNQLAVLLKDVDLIIHLASVRGKADNYETFIENEILMENILKAMLMTKCEKIIFMSSIAVYSDQTIMPWRENQCVSPQTFYGLSKLTGEYLCRLYSQKGIKYIIFRCGIVYGMDHTKRMISAFIDEAVHKERIQLTGKSVAKRDFVYVKEVVKALQWAMKDDFAENQIYNLGSGEKYTNLEIAMAVNECFGNDGNLEYIDDVKEQIINSYMSTEKLYDAGFEKSYSLIQALEDIKDGTNDENI